MPRSSVNTAESCDLVRQSAQGQRSSVSHRCSWWKCIQQKVLRPFSKHNEKVILLHFACLGHACSSDLDLFYPLLSTLIPEGQCVEMPVFHVERLPLQGVMSLAQEGK